MPGPPTRSQLQVGSLTRRTRPRHTGGPASNMINLVIRCLTSSPDASMHDSFHARPWPDCPGGPNQEPGPAAGAPAKLIGELSWFILVAPLLSKGNSKLAGRGRLWFWVTSCHLLLCSGSFFVCLEAMEQGTRLAPGAIATRKPTSIIWERQRCSNQKRQDTSQHLEFRIFRLEKNSFENLLPLL